MQQTWKPTAPGKLFTTTPDWSFHLQDEMFALVVQGQTLNGNVSLIKGLAVTLGTFWATLTVPGANGKVLRLDGIPNTEALKLKKSVLALIDAQR